MELTGKRILVTGADGFIGSHLCETLVRAGHQVRALVLYNSFGSWGWLDEAPPQIRQSLEIVPGDVRDPHLVASAMKDCQVVMHLAALIAIPYSYHSPDSYLDTNVRGTLNVLQAARALQTARVVHTSTSEVYGSARFVPITEDHPLSAQSPYAASKIAADQMALAFHRSFATPVAVVRPFNTYGPRQSARAVIPTVITQLLAGRRNIRLGALGPTRDFNHVADTVAGFIAAATADQSVGQVTHFGGGFEISIGDTARMIMDVMGREAAIEEEPQRLRPSGSEVDRLCADGSRARALGWQPAYAGEAGLRRGLAETAAWFAQPQNLSRYKAELYNL